MQNEPKQAILLTPPGAGAIAVVRLLAADIGDALQVMVGKRPPANRTIHVTLRDGETVIDDPVIVQNEAGTVADVNLHGGPWVVSTFLDLCRRQGFEIVGSIDGVAPAGAVDGADAIETLMLQHLPLARTEEAARALLEQPRLWREFDWDSASAELIETIAADASLWWLLHPPHVAIVGPPNVGKSTLANQLFAQERSITADVPGTTRDWVGEIANIDGLAVMLVDTPGIRVTSDAIEAEAIERSQQVVQTADLVLRILDASCEAMGSQIMDSRLQAEEMLVLNKFDRAADWARSTEGAIATVATRSEGVDELRRAIRTRLGCDRTDVDRPRWWTQKQRTVLMQKQLS